MNAESVVPSFDGQMLSYPWLLRGVVELRGGLDHGSLGGPQCGPRLAARREGGYKQRCRIAGSRTNAGTAPNVICVSMLGWVHPPPQDSSVNGFCVRCDELPLAV